MIGSRSGFQDCSAMLVTACRILRRPAQISRLVSALTAHSFHTSQASQASLGYQLKDNIKDCFHLLNLQEDCSYDELREAYLGLAKTYHPDSGSSTADPKKFTQVKEAYNAIKNHLQGLGKEVTEEDDESIFDIKHTAPQHRQYLSYEGVGFGTPSQRQKQYQQYRISRATENVYTYRTDKLTGKYESSLVTKDKKATRKQVVRNAIDRLVEDLIQESMARGDFDNLPGKGKKLEYQEHNPMVDTFMHNLNKVLINNGYAPEWVTLEKEIREGIKKARSKLLERRISLGQEPLPPSKKARWDRFEKEFSDEIDDINKKINKLNLIVPSFWQQMIPYRLNRELQRVLDEYTVLDRAGKAVPPKPSPLPQMDMYHYPTDKTSPSLREMWQHIKTLFSSPS